MRGLPPRLGKLKRAPALGEWLNQVWDYVASLAPRDSHGTITEHTSMGVFRKTKPGEEAEASGEPIWL